MAPYDGTYPAQLTFGATTLLFPVSTTWGTFLHAAGPLHVLLIVSCLVGLDLFIARVGAAHRIDSVEGEQQGGELLGLEVEQRLLRQR